MAEIIDALAAFENLIVMKCVDVLLAVSSDAQAYC